MDMFFVFLFHVCVGFAIHHFYTDYYIKARLYPLLSKDYEDLVRLYQQTVDERKLRPDRLSSPKIKAKTQDKKTIRQQEARPVQEPESTPDQDCTLLRKFEPGPNQESPIFDSVPNRERRSTEPNQKQPSPTFELVLNRESQSTEPNQHQSSPTFESIPISRSIQKFEATLNRESLSSVAKPIQKLQTVLNNESPTLDQSNQKFETARVLGKPVHQGCATENICESPFKKTFVPPGPIYARGPRLLYSQTAPVRINNHSTHGSVFSKSHFQLPNTDNLFRVRMGGTVSPQSSGILSMYICINGDTIGLIPAMHISPLATREVWNFDVTLVVDNEGVFKCCGQQCMQRIQYNIQNVGTRVRRNQTLGDLLNIKAKWSFTLNPKNELDVDFMVITSY